MNSQMQFTVGGLVCPQPIIGYNQITTSYNDPKLSKKMLYSLYVNSTRNRTSVNYTTLQNLKNSQS